MNWMYVLIGGVILGAYALIYYIRIKRTRKVDEYIEETSKAQAPPADGGPQIPGGVTRDMVQHGDGDNARK